MNLQSRVRRLEVAAGAAPGSAGQRVVDGTASLADFEELLADRIGFHRTVVVARSARFLRAREEGREEWAWWPDHVASAIVAVPPEEMVETRLIDLLVELAGLRPTATRRRPVPDELLTNLWRTASIMTVVLGGPDGLPLRTAVAAGHYANTEAQLVAWNKAELLDGSGPAGSSSSRPM